MIDAIQNLENLGSVRDKLNQLVTASNSASTDLTGIEVTLSELATLITNAAPPGIVSMWSGSSTSIPPGWKLCDGTLGTPNLRDRFVVGAGSTYEVNATGGAATVTLTQAQTPAHTHTYSGNTGGHSNDHTHAGGNGGQFALQGAGGGINGVQAGGSYVGGWNVGGMTGTSANHTHAFSGTTSSIGSGTAHENLPPYYALCYVMKT